MHHFLTSKIPCLAISLMVLSSITSAQDFLQPAGAPPEGARMLSLREAFQMVEAQNLQVLIGRELALAAEQNARRVRAGLLPSVSFDASQNRSRSAGGGGVLGGGASIADRFQARFSGRVPLLDATALADHRVARLESAIADLDYETTLQDVLQLVGEAYIEHVRNQARMRVIDANLERDRVLYQLAVNQFEAGVATPIDVTRAEVRLAVDERDRLQQQTLVMQSELEIKRLLRLDYERPIWLTDPAPVAQNLVGIDSRTSLASVLEARPDYRRESLTLERNQLALRAAGWQRFPEISGFADYGWRSRHPLDGREEREWTIGVGLSVPVFDGFEIQANKLRAGAFVRVQERVLASLEETVDASYRLALTDARSRLAQIEVTRKQVALSEKELELARTRFQEGVADNRDVVEAQANLAQANDDLVQSIFLYNLSRITLARVRGDVRAVLAL